MMKNYTLFFWLLLSVASFSQGELTHSIEQYEQNGEMMNSGKNEYTYNLNGNLVKEEYYYWDDFNSIWVISEETAYSYNNDNKVLEEIYSNGDGQLSFRQVYEYDSNGLLLNIKSYDFDLVWVLEGQYTMTYENNLLVSYIEESDKDKVDLSYDSNGLVTSIVELELVDDEYVNVYRSVYSYTSNNKVSSINYEEYENSMWNDDGTETYGYDTSSNVISVNFVDDDGTYTDAFSYDTESLFSDYSHPFKDKTGLDYLFNPTESNFINKLLTETSDDYITTYYYSDDPTASSNEFSSIQVSLFPNPVIDYLTIESDVQIKEVTVADVSGKKIVSTSETEIDFTALNKGVYLVKVISEEGGVAVKKVVKE